MSEPSGGVAPVFVSTGQLPPAVRLESMLEEAQQRFAGTTSGSVSDVYPALGRVDPGLYGLSVATTDGRHFDAGDSRVPFTIMSAVKPFTFAVAAQSVGVEALCEQVGVNATDRWERARSVMSNLAGRNLVIDEEVYTSASETNHRNRALAILVHQRSPLPIDPAEALDIYTRLSCLSVTAHDLAAMGSVLATGGVVPHSGERVFGAECCRTVMAVMTTEGLYEKSGEWLCRVGLPGKSGIGGGVVTVSPGKGALAVFSPRLDATGNSVRGQDASAYLSRALGLDLFAADVQ